LLPPAAAHAAGRQQSRKASQADAAPVLTRFSIVDALKSRGMSPGRLESPKVSLTADGTADGAAAVAQQQEQQQQAGGSNASLAGRPASSGSVDGQDADSLLAFQRSLARLSLWDGTASVPLEVGSPVRGSGRRQYGSGVGPAEAEAPQLPSAAASRSGSPGAADTSLGAGAAGGAAAVAGTGSLADEHHARGYALRKQGDFAGAVVEYSRALEHDPCHFKALFNRAFSYDKVDEIWL
jgi:hypothetical protein